MVADYCAVGAAGGKGSGKTALLDLIAHSFSDRRLVQNRNSFVRRIAGDDPSMDLSVEFADGSRFSKLLRDADIVDGAQITYIAQGELEDRIADKVRLGSHIRDLVLSSPQVKDSVRRFELREAEERLRSSTSALKALHDSIQTLEDKTASSVEEQIKRSERVLEAELTDARAKIEVLERRAGEERAQKAQEVQASLSDLEHTRDSLLEIRGSLDEVAAFTSEALPQAIRAITTINQALERHGIESILTVPSQYPANELPAAREAIGTRLTEMLSSIQTAAEELAGLEEGIREYAELLRQEADTGERLGVLRRRREELVGLRDELAEFRERRRQIGRDVLDDALLQREIYADLFATFAENKQRVLSDVVFAPEVVYDRVGLEEAVATVVDRRQVRDLPDQLKDLHSAFASLTQAGAADVDAVLEAIEAVTVSLHGKLKASRAFTRATLYHVLWDNYLTVRPSVRYKGATLDQLSLGQKATVLVKVYLAQGTTPIVIDSHDEHMDNEFIMDELVGALREAKEYRQVIIASNNGNVVVNSDAEQIVLANFTTGRIWYFSGSLEEPAVREAALRVLEGGEDAFRMRREKYRVRA